jgi:hypothetical protein
VTRGKDEKEARMKPIKRVFYEFPDCHRWFLTARAAQGSKLPKLPDWVKVGAPVQEAAGYKGEIEEIEVSFVSETPNGHVHGLWIKIHNLDLPGSWLEQPVISGQNLSFSLRVSE